MAKIGRNDPCACGSGKKFKNCCAGKAASAPAGAEGADTPQQDQPTINAEVEKVQGKAMEKRASMWSRGVFIFFSTREGDGWVLDASAMDALQVASGGRSIEVDVAQTAESIEITWSHQFVAQKNFTVTDYADKRQTTYADYPASRIRNLVTKLRNSLSPELLASIHLSDEKQPAT